MNYGIPDPAAGAYAIPEQRQALAVEIETTIRRFEPRLSKISVSLIAQADDSSGGRLKLKVDAELRADLMVEPVSFETLLEPISRDVSVRET